MTFNERRNILGSVFGGEKVGYRLHNINYSAQKGRYSVQLLRKSKWPAQYFTPPEYFSNKSYITSLDFNPSGELVAMTDNCNKCLIVDVNTDSYIYHLNMFRGYECKLGLEIWPLSYQWCLSFLLLIHVSISNFSYSYIQDCNDFGKCRWSTNPDEPLLFVRHYHDALNILDIEKKTLTLKESIPLTQYCNFSRNVVLSPRLFFLHSKYIANFNFLNKKNMLLSLLEGRLLCYFPLFLMTFSSLFQLIFVPYIAIVYWIDVSQRDGNLLAAVDDKDLKIFDKRESKIVKTIDGIHESKILWFVLWILSNF